MASVPGKFPERSADFARSGVSGQLLCCVFISCLETPQTAPWQRVPAWPISNVDSINTHPNVKMVQSGRRNWLQSGEALTVKKHVLCSIRSFCCSCINEQECKGTCKIATLEYWETCCCPRLIENLARRVKSVSQIGASGQ